MRSILILLAIGLLFGCSNIKSENSSIQLDNPPLKNIKYQNSISYGLYSFEGKIVKDQTLTPVNGVINNVLKIEHSIDDTREYMLIVFEDYIQKKSPLMEKGFLVLPSP